MKDYNHGYNFRKHAKDIYYKYDKVFMNAGYPGFPNIETTENLNLTKLRLPL